MKIVFSKINRFYAKLYFLGHSRLSKDDKDAFIEVLLFIAFCQSNNFLTIVNIILLMSEITFENSLKWFYVLIFLVFFILNYIFYEHKKNNLEILSNRKIYIDRYMLLKALLYLAISSTLFVISMVKYIEFAYSFKS